MKAFNVQVFDDTIAGAGPLWYSPASFEDQLGSADALVFLAAAANVTGSPLLTVQVEHSADGQNWMNVAGTAEVAAVNIVTTPVTVGYVNGVSAAMLSFVRLRVSMTGTTPQCRLKLTVTGRTF